MKVVVNNCHGGFGLSDEAISKIKELRALREASPATPTFHTDDEFGGEEGEEFWGIPRNDPDLVAVVEEFGARANGTHADLKIVVIPDDVDWQIGEYDGSEWVEEKHRTWYA